MSDVLRIADREFQSRLFVGTGKYRSFQEMARCHAASGSEVVTVAVRRVNLTDKSKESMIDYIDRSKMSSSPTPAVYRRRSRADSPAGPRSGSFELGEVGSDRRSENISPTMRGCSKPRAYWRKKVRRSALHQRRSSERPQADRRRSGGCDAARRSHRLRPGDPERHRSPDLRETITEVPLIVDAGVGTASDAAIALELGFDGILMNPPSRKPRTQRKWQPR